MDTLKAVLVWLSEPNHLVLFSILLIQVWKLARPYLPGGVVSTGDKVESFFSWAIPALYQNVQGLEKVGVITKSSKLGAFLDQLFLEAQKHNVKLSVEDVAKAKAIVGTIAAGDKPGNPTLPAPSK